MKPFRERTYYELLEVPTGASEEQIRSAYQRALERSAAGAEAVEAGHLEELRDLLGKAAAELTDPVKRTNYDRTLQLGAAPPPTWEPEPERQLAMDELLDSAESPRLRPSERLCEGGRRLRGREAPRSVSSRQVGQRQAAPMSKQHAQLDRAPQLAEESAIANAEAALIHASARGEHLRNRPVDIPPDAIFNGDLLRRIRQGRGFAIHEVAERTRIPLKHLENIEAGRYNQLPATVYLRGILTSLSKELGLDPTRVTKDYIQLMSKG
ncbi:MAG TPA: helix-turn-helix domain-containing protein, partial [Myxococcaceae bacterium]|nr:helix-turn-helix domain-containing protein [Myxococcaceae bacterium]